MGLGDTLINRVTGVARGYNYMILNNIYGVIRLCFVCRQTCHMASRCYINNWSARSGL